MDNKIVNLLGKVHAEDALKAETTNYLYAEIRKRRKPARINYWRAAAACASFVMFLFWGTLSYRTYFTPVAYIDIDVNPSIELAVSRMGKVVGYQAYNDDGTAILNTVEIKRIGYEEAVEKLIDAMGEEGYFENGSLLSVTVQTKESGREDSLLSSLRETIDAASKRHSYAITSDVYAVTAAVKDSAAAHHVSPAKYLVIQELTGLDKNANFEDCRNHSVSELKQLVQEKYAGHEDMDDPYTHEERGHHH